ncbi:GNAT family N-acetyltransferase [Aeromonas salmonicida]|uniref:GNAT family N-acetyltransferase n=1 Tax=Aeromonas salmonicida TaxID=645 RepID=UPI00073B1390|nr:GNAT family N-acetyltransferase [Aeromonas salmonicida]KTA78851.1 acetyltransferase [Aeromonas salmonicida]MDE7529483.1 GNAT family N-acetyltransferase [Aeromonas salmonicida]MDE7533749.1 GNAT family N-acetyltransferase [Aeromonas salmonicida]
MDTHPGFATDLLFDRYQGNVVDHEQFWAVRTPDAPDYYFGNYLLLPTPPSDRDKGWLEASFDKLIGLDPRVQHRTFQWPLAEGQNSRVAGFVAAGYQYMECVVLALDATNLHQAATIEQTVEARPFSPADWDVWLAFELNERDPGHSVENYLPYLQSRRRLYEAMIADGLGKWWGIWQEEQLVASCGLFFTGTMGRFQLVRTHQEWRNRGLCRQLLSQVARQGLERARQLIIVADEHYHAQRVYRSLGFTPVARIGSLCRWPHETQ